MMFRTFYPRFLKSHLHDSVASSSNLQVPTIDIWAGAQLSLMKTLVMLIQRRHNSFRGWHSMDCDGIPIEVKSGLELQGWSKALLESASYHERRNG